ncbi:MAG: lysylphosphatidylglycerol synthase transmembrane domain-containing protein [Bacteroidales bacterium]|nr:lysylphosphatidylglycerol synthase transmembrane domain-containing protein [Bacteroidales bacterium]
MATRKRKSIWSLLLKYVVPLVISVGLCWLLFHDFDFDEMMRLIRDECDFSWIALGLFVTVCSHVFRALRWRIQLRALGIDPPLFALVLSIFGTYAVNLVFPRLGEVWRTGYIAQRQHAPFTAVFGSMVADRLADTVTVLLLMLMAFGLASGSIMAFLDENAASYAAIARMLTSPWLWGAGVVGLGALWWLLSRKNAGGWLGRLQTALRELWQGFIVIATMKGKGLWLLYTVGIWGCFFMAMYVEFFSFDFTAGVYHQYGIVAVLVTFVLSSISMGVPSNGGIGPWQWSVIFALGIYGVASGPAGTFGTVVLLCSTLLNIVLGIFTFIAVAVDRRRSKSTDNQQSKQIS